MLYCYSLRGKVISHEKNKGIYKSYEGMRKLKGVSTLGNNRNKRSLSETLKFCTRSGSTVYIAIVLEAQNKQSYELIYMQYHSEKKVGCLES